jgi:hypothetical protein
MNNNEDILKKILLHMKYDSKKTLSENELDISNPYVKTVDIFGQPLAFYGKVVSVLAQELASSQYTSSKLNKLIETMCISVTGGHTSNGGEYDTLLRNCVDKNLSFMKELNTNAPHTIIKNGDTYVLYFNCGEYSDYKDQNMQYKLYPMMCSKDNISNVGYWNDSKSMWLTTVDLKKQQQIKSQKPITQKKEKDLEQNLKDFEITGKKSNSNNSGVDVKNNKSANPNNLQMVDDMEIIDGGGKNTEDGYTIFLSGGGK